MNATASIPVNSGASRIPVSWGRVNTESMRLPDSCYSRGRKRAVKQIVMHHGAFTASHAWMALKDRGLSYHFVIDSDGTIYQFVDLADTAWHAGGPTNARSIGICLANPHELKWRDREDQAGRPVVTSQVHGVTVEHLGFYEVQVQAAKSLVRALANHFSIPLTTPPFAEGLIESDWGQYGVIGHYHLGRRKIDPTGLDFHALIRKEESPWIETTS